MTADPLDLVIKNVRLVRPGKTAVEAMEKGANGFLNKPFTDRQLNEAIAELMR